MKFSITSYTAWNPNGLTVIVEQFPTHMAAIRAKYPGAPDIVFCESLPGDSDVFVVTRGNGRKFVVVVTAILDGSETDLANALGRDLGPDDFGKDPAMLIQSDDYRREAVRG